jgi:hypothetical protein
VAARPLPPPCRFDSSDSSRLHRFKALATGDMTSESPPPLLTLTRHSRAPPHTKLPNSTSHLLHLLRTPPDPPRIPRNPIGPRRNRPPPLSAVGRPRGMAAPTPLRAAGEFVARAGDFYRRFGTAARDLSISSSDSLLGRKAFARSGR